MIQKLKLKWFVSKKTETEMICETETKLKWFVGEKTETETEMIFRTEISLLANEIKLALIQPRH